MVGKLGERNFEFQMEKLISIGIKIENFNPLSCLVLRFEIIKLPALDVTCSFTWTVNQIFPEFLVSILIVGGG